MLKIKVRVHRFSVFIVCLLTADAFCSPMTVYIDITSDLACPWCYVGWKRLERGMNEFSALNKEAKFEVGECGI